MNEGLEICEDLEENLFELTGYEDIGTDLVCDRNDKFDNFALLIFVYQVQTNLKFCRFKKI